VHLGLEGGRGERERPECLPRGAPTAPGMEQLLGVAINEGDAESARALLKKNRHLCNYVDPDMQGTLLQVAALKGHSDCVEALLEAGADMEIAHPIYGMTPFLWACQNTHLLCVQLLVRAGCNTAARDSSGLSGQELAKEDLHPGWEAIVKYLAEHTGKTIDITRELEFSTKQQRRMRKTLADAGDHDDALSLLFTTSRPNRVTSRRCAKKSARSFRILTKMVAAI
jgi:ankyrin repeat protein